MGRKRTGKPVGAPPKGTYSNNSEALSARVPADIKARLVEASEKNGVSLNQEIALRLDHSFTFFSLDVNEFGSTKNLAVCRLIGMMMRNYHAFEGDALWDTAEAHEELKETVMTILDGFGPDGGIPEPTLNESAGRRRGRSKLAQLTESKTLPERERVGGELIERSSDECSYPEIWTGLGSLAKKLEVKK